MERAGLRTLTLAVALAGASCGGVGLDEPEDPAAEIAAMLPPPAGAPPVEDGSRTGRASAPPAAPPPAAAPPPPRAGPGGSPDPPPALGAPCAKDARAAPVDPCGPGGKITLAFDPRTTSLARDPPCKLLDVDPRAMFPTDACVAGDEIVAVEACAMCRLWGAGWSARGRIAEMTDAQHLFLQKQLGLPATAPLRTASKWRAAILSRAAGR